MKLNTARAGRGGPFATWANKHPELGSQGRAHGAELRRARFRREPFMSTMSVQMGRNRICRSRLLEVGIAGVAAFACALVSPLAQQPATVATLARDPAVR